MKVKQQTLPPDVIKKWPEILNDTVVRVIPLQYVNTLTVQFKNGKMWAIDPVARNMSIDVASNITELLLSYESTIDSIDFHIDVEYLKLDVKKSIKKFFKEK